MKVAICIPCYGDTKAKFTLSLAGMIYRSAREGIEVQTLMASGSILPAVREELAQASNGADYSLWIDADHTFPEDALVRLLGHGKPVVSCNFRVRDPEHYRTVAYTSSGEPARGTGLEQVPMSGMGLCLINGSVWPKLKVPYFRYAMMDRGNGPEMVGEDSYFFNSLVVAGIPAFVDHDLSNECGHIAEVVLTLR